MGQVSFPVTLLFDPGLTSRKAQSDLEVDQISPDHQPFGMSLCARSYGGELQRWIADHLATR